MELCDVNLHTYIYKAHPEFMEPLVRPETGVVRFNVGWKVLEDIAQGLDFVHKSHEVHRDLKPQNGKPPRIPS
jgi:serine/threonine protein kinase